LSTCSKRPAPRRWVLFSGSCRKDQGVAKFSKAAGRHKAAATQGKRPAPLQHPRHEVKKRAPSSRSKKKKKIRHASQTRLAASCSPERTNLLNEAQSLEDWSRTRRGGGSSTAHRERSAKPLKEELLKLGFRSHKTATPWGSQRKKPISKSEGGRTTSNLEGGISKEESHPVMTGKETVWGVVRGQVCGGGKKTQPLRKDLVWRNYRDRLN